MPSLLDRVTHTAKPLLEETIPLFLPALIIYSTYDFLRFFQLGLDETQQHFLHSFVDFNKYSVLQHGFKPILLLLFGLKEDDTLSSVLNTIGVTLYFGIVGISVIATILFHLMCLYRSYERKWQGLHQLVMSMLKSGKRYQ